MKPEIKNKGEKVTVGLIGGCFMKIYKIEFY